MISLAPRLAAALALSLAIAACDESSDGAAPPARDPAASAAEACTGNMRLAVARDDRLKAFAGKERALCACLVNRVKGDKSLADADRAPIYAAFGTRPGSKESRDADRALTPVGSRAIGVAMVECGKSLTAK